MENESLSCEISGENVVYTLMKVSQLDSTSSSSLEQSTSTINKTVDCEELSPTIINTNKQSLVQPNECPINYTINIGSDLGKIINRKLLQLYWTNYIHWKTLLAFGFALWIALCIADKRSHQQFSTLEVQKVPDTIEIEIDENVGDEPDEKILDKSNSNWFYNFPSNISWANRLPNTTEACILSLFMVMIIFIEFRIRNQNTKHKLQGPCTECHHDLQRAKLNGDKSFKNKLTMENLETEKEMEIYNELGSASPSKNQLHAVKIIPYDRSNVDPDLFWELRIIESRDRHRHKHNTKRNNNEHINKSGIDSNVATNIDRSLWDNDDNVNINNVMNDNHWKLNSRDFYTNNYNCSLPFNNYNPIESINVNSTYDLEIYKYIMSKCNTSTTAFEEITGDLWKYKNNIGRRKNQTDNNNPDNDELSSLSTVKNNKNNNNRVISSSPAFKKFLSGLKNNPTAFNRQTWIYN